MKDVILEKDNYIFYYIEDVLVLEYKTNHISLEVANQVINDKLEYFLKGSGKCVIDMQKVVKFDSDARKRLNQPDANSQLKICAVVINSRIQEIMFTIFSKIYKQKIPIKSFINMDNALKWIRNYLLEL